MFHASPYYGPNHFAIFFDSIPIHSQTKIAEVAKFLDCTPRTLRRYLSGEVCPPRSAVAALFHESPYGLSATETHQTNELRITHGLCNTLLAENQRLRTTSEKLNAEIAALKKNAQANGEIAINDSFFAFR